jgi:hypothetical protein
VVSLAAVLCVWLRYDLETINRRQRRWKGPEGYSVEARPVALEKPRLEGSPW